MVLSGLIRGLLCGLLFITPVSAFSEEAGYYYVDDVIWISMREGNGKAFPNKAVLKSGTRLVVLEHDEETKFSHVRRDNGDTGWVRTRYLRDEPIAALKVVTMQNRIDRLVEQHASLQKKFNALDKISNSSSSKNKNLEKENVQLKRDLDEIRNLSKNQVSLHNSNTQLKQQINNQKRELETLQKENSEISSNLYTYTIGTGIVSLLVGLYIGTTPIRREKRWRSIG